MGRRRARAPPLHADARPRRLQPPGQVRAGRGRLPRRACACASTPTSASTQHLPGARPAARRTIATAAGDGVRFVPGLSRGAARPDVRLRRGAQPRARAARLQARPPVHDRRARLVVVRRRPRPRHHAVLRAGRGLRRPRAARRAAALDVALRAAGRLARQPRRLRHGDGQPSAADYPSYQYAEPAPAFGFALESNGPSWVHGRFSYRRVYNTGESITTQFPDAELAAAATTPSTARASRRSASATRLDLNKRDLGGAQGRLHLRPLQPDRRHATTAGSRPTSASASPSAPTSTTSSRPSTPTRSGTGSRTARSPRSPGRVGDRRHASASTSSASGGARLWRADGDPTTFGAGAVQGARRRSRRRRIRRPAVRRSVDAATCASRSPATRATTRTARVTTTVDALGNLAGALPLRHRATSASAACSRPATAAAARAAISPARRGSTAAASRSARARRSTAGPTRCGPIATRPRSATCSPAASSRRSVANFRVEWEHDMNRLVGQRYRVARAREPAGAQMSARTTRSARPSRSAARAGLRRVLACVAALAFAARRPRAVGRSPRADRAGAARPRRSPRRRDAGDAAAAPRCPATPRCPLAWMPPGSRREPASRARRSSRRRRSRSASTTRSTSRSSS